MNPSTSGHTLKVGFGGIVISIFLGFIFITHKSQVQEKDPVYLKLFYLKNSHRTIHDCLNVSDNIKVNIEKFLVLLPTSQIIFFPFSDCSIYTNIYMYVYIYNIIFLSL